jgi:hypothetical protein
MFNLTYTQTMERDGGVYGDHGHGSAPGGDRGATLLLLFLGCPDGGGVDEISMEAAHRHGSTVWRCDGIVDDD